MRFLRKKLATSKLWLAIASDLWLRLRGSLRPGAGGGSFPLYGGSFARSYSVSKLAASHGSSQTGSGDDTRDRWWQKGAVSLSMPKRSLQASLAKVDKAGILCAMIPWPEHASQRKTKGGENSGGGKTYHKSPPQKRFWTPHLWYDFPPPLCSRNVILLRGNGHRPDKSRFVRPPRLVLEGCFMVRFPPKNRTIRFAPPPPLRISIWCTLPTKLLTARLQNETAPENKKKTFKSMRKMVWKTREKIQKRSETCPKLLKPLSRRLKVSHQHFSKIRKEKEKGAWTQENPRDTGRVSPGHPLGQTGVYRPVVPGISC